MPTYEYLCRTCGHRFETWQKMTDEPLTVCPECGQEIRRVLFPAGVVFKGSGFYKTDYSSNGSKSATQATSSTSEHTHDHSESKTASESTTPKSDSSTTTTSSASSSTTPASAS